MNSLATEKSRTSSFLKHAPIAFGDCRWTEGFWAEKLRNCEQTMLPYMGELLCGDVGHALNNFKIAAGLKVGEHKGMFWHDGDFYKWLEAATYVYAQNGDERLIDQVNEHIAIIAQAQEPDGYLQTQIQLRPNVDRYENRKYHEMYNTGHLLIAACVHHKVTGRNNFLDIAIRHADLLYTIFHPETKQFGRFGFNQTQIMGLVELYRSTHDKKYLRLAERFINRRGTFEVVHHPVTEGYPIGDMVQERTPIREADEAVGHAVLALYYYAGAADVFAETGEQALGDALDRLWANVTEKKMYVTGAVGQTHYGASTNRDKIEEGFIDAYMMPNMTAYNETCANLCNAMFSYRMLGIRGEAKYADVIELVMYNSGLSGISASGKEYFYANPLRMVDGARSYNDHESATETPEREPYLECFCCPPNLVRTIAKVSGWAYSQTENGIAVNLYGGNQLDTKLADGSRLALDQETAYPWEGRVKLTVTTCKATPFEIKLRIPGWAAGTKVSLNGVEVKEEAIAGNYLIVNRLWNFGDVILIDMPLDIKLIGGHPRIEEVRNQVAIQRGPMIYCLESPDLPAETSILDVYLPAGQKLKPEHRPDLLGGLTTISGTVKLREHPTDKMYHTTGKPAWKTVSTSFLPYYAWSNRGKSEMTVWLPVLWD
ncbi:glycoside hydrolase family 127 protein [Neolewinella persica]|uniref:glycoside hydrolase family 127 protein n=1 Tax=Neolewinella persica TaxID=70998 RepID=UPI00036B231D|nr:beta-L-arabinofuranosidase domain-containing protein [Neolewinella persica]